DAVLALEARDVREPAAEVARQPVELAIRYRGVHARERRQRGELPATALQDLANVRELVDVGLCGHARRVGFQPDLFHRSPLHYRRHWGVSSFGNQRSLTDHPPP